MQDKTDVANDNYMMCLTRGVVMHFAVAVVSVAFFDHRIDVCL